MAGVLVCAETRRGAIRDVSYELLTAARELGGEVTVLCLGAVPAFAADRVLHAGAEHFDPHVYAAAVRDAIERVRPDWILTAHSVDALGYAAAVAAELDLGFASDVHALNPVRSGARMVATLAFDGPAVLALRPGAFPPAAPGEAPVEEIELAGGVVEHLGYREPEPGVDITTASFLLALGGGVREQAEFDELVKIAEAVHATVAVSRPPVDAGFATAARQVGQSGKTVKPRVYLALGISGAVQHIAGIRGADTVIAVNTDPTAPIFHFADYGAVADLLEVARELPRHLSQS
jgi:electron transfer flavoprotein alpha subunit